MKHALVTRALVISACVLPWLGGCMAFDPDAAIPPAPGVTGAAAQDKALQQQVQKGYGAEPDTFLPLERAQSAVAAAQAQQDVNVHTAAELQQARDELEQAQQLWLQSDADKRDPEQLRRIEEHAHRAQRLAQIAQYTALRELNLAELDEINSELERQRAQAAAARRAAAASGERLVGQRVVPGMLGSFSFQPGTAQLTSSSRPAVVQLATILQQSPAIGVVILGHTSNSKPPEQELERFVQANPQLEQQDLLTADKVAAYNLALSDARARAVAQALVDAGVAARRIGARGFGSSQPVASNNSAQGRAANERVEAVIVPGPDSPNSPLRPPSG